MNEKSKKKVLYIITKSVWGGAGKYVYDLAVNLDKKKFEVFVAAGGNGPLAQKLITAGIPYFEIKNFQKNVSLFKEIFAYTEIMRLLLKIKPDIVHANSSKAGGIAGTAGLDYKFLHWNFRLKTIFTAHGWAFHEKRPWWQILLIKLLSIVMSFYYSEIICVSEFDRQSAIKNHIAPAKKLVAIHNGIEIEKYKFLSRENSRAKFNISPDTIAIGTIGEFTKNKGQQYLIEAARKLKISAKGGSASGGKNLKFILIGWGENISNLKSQSSKLGLEDEVLLIDNIPEAAPYLKAFDIFVLPSVKEGLPYTLLEAGLAGLPVIATNVGGIPEIITPGNGLLFEPTDSGALAEKIEELVNDPEKRKILGSNLWHRIVSEFSLSKMLNSTLAAYE